MDYEKLRARLRGVSRFGTLCGVFAMLVFITGCPTAAPRPTGPECEEDADCAVIACQTATCDADGNCAYTDDCDADHCVNEVCVACLDDAECDDADACTGDETCVDNACVAGDAVDCGDDDLCTQDVCDPADGSCTNPDVECADGTECDPDTGSCVAAPQDDLVGFATDANTGEDVDFDDLAVGDMISLEAPAPPTMTRQVPADCTCAWTADPATAGTFSAADECETDFTVDEAGGFTISVTVTCAGADTTFSQGATAAEAPAIPCDSADTCDDDNLCTVDECINNLCDNSPVDCDDAIACTDDTCDIATGDCVNADNCAEGETCDMVVDAGTCEGPVVCVEDADCDDGLFCNGAETCDVDTGDCLAGTRPCDDNDDAGCDDPDGLATEECSEGDTAAVCTACEIPTVDFTLSQDNLTGTTGADTFSAPLEFNIQSGTQIATFQTGDSANGLAGDDILNASFNTAGTVVPQSVAGIETINITNFSGGTLILSSTNVSGVDTFNCVSSVNDVSMTGLQELADCGFKDINDTTVDLALTFAQTATTAGAADAFTCTLENATVGTLTVTTNAANGFETMNLVSNGTVDNRLTTLTQTTGNTMATAVLTGVADLRLDTMPATVLTYNASAMTGGLQLGSGTEDTVYAEFATAGMTQITGGSGDDLFIFEDTLTSADFSTSGETLDCGDGTDVVQNSFAATNGAASKLRNCEEVRYNASAAGVSVNFSGHTGLTTITNEEDGTANTFTLLNVPAISGVFPTLNFRGDNTQTAQTYDTITYTAVGATGSSDTLAITVGNRGTALNAGSAVTNVHTIGGAALTAAGFEVATIAVTDGPATFNGLTMLALTTLTVTGSSNVTMGTVSPVAATGLVQLDASGVTGNFSVTVADLASGGVITTAGGNDTVTITAGSPGTSSSITLGAGNDTYTGDATTVSADTIDAGAGTDTIQSGTGADTVTTGSGNDTVIYDQILAINETDISDFTAGTGGDVMKFDISDLLLAGGTEYVGAVGSVAVNSSEEILVLTGAAYATDEAAEDAVAGRVTTDGLDVVIIYFNSTTTTTHIVYDPDSGVDGAATTVLIGNLTNITSLATHATLTTANIDSQA